MAVSIGRRSGMTAISRTALAIALAAILSACGPSGPEHQQGHRDASGRHPMEAEPSDPYPASVMKMHDAMTSAVGADVSDTWVRKMIAHHEGAIAMDNIEVARGHDDRVIPIARRMAAKQQREIAELQQLVRRGAAPDPASARPYRAAEKRMHEAMMEAKGSDSSHTFVRKMIPHHRGAIAMSQIVLAQGTDERVAAIARRVIIDQEAEIGELRAFLTGTGLSAPSALRPEPAASAGPSENSQK